jgi:hypothetical protein
MCLVSIAVINSRNKPCRSGCRRRHNPTVRSLAVEAAEPHKSPMAVEVAEPRNSLRVLVGAVAAVAVVAALWLRQQLRQSRHRARPRQGLRRVRGLLRRQSLRQSRRL